VTVALAAVVVVAACSTPNVGGAPGATGGGGAAAGGAARYQVIAEPDDAMAAVYRLLGSARSSLDLYMYELVDQHAETVLASLAARGVRVRVVLDRNREGAANAAANAFLTGHGVQVRWAPPRFAASHLKAAVVDGRTAAIMTLNLTTRYYPSSRDFAVLDADPADVAAIAQVFDADFTGTAVTAGPGRTLVWSPGAQAPLAALIASAQSTVAIENEEMSAPTIISALAADARRGVTVTVTMTDSPSWSAAFATLSAAGAKIRVYHGETPIYIHAKVVAVDAARPGGRVFIGSENFTVASLEHNRELGVIIDTPAPVASVAATVAHDFAGATPWAQR
jgi:phosphatidylserine/phosphatidylglycerophosphate/cardiolipin synthase-like enzyme